MLETIWYGESAPYRVGWHESMVESMARRERTVPWAPVVMLVAKEAWLLEREAHRTVSAGESARVSPDDNVVPCIVVQVLC
jgi:hypothetical protein